MKRDEIVKLAKEAGILMRSHEHQEEPTKLEIFAALVEAKVREECASVCEQYASNAFNTSSCNAALELRDIISTMYTS